MRAMRFDPEDWAGPLVAAGAGLLAAGAALAPGPGMLLIAPAVGLLGLACVSVRSGFLLFGPFPRFELARHSRRTRVHLWRTVVLLLGGSAVLVLYADGEGRRTADAAAGLLLIGKMLFVGGALATSGMGAMAVLNDQQSKQADILLVTDLRGRELTVGRTAAATAVAASYPLALLPLAVLLPPLFGVDPAVLLLAGGYAGVSLLSFVALVVLAAARFGCGLWLLVGGYLSLGWAATLLQAAPAVWAFPGPPIAVSMSDLVRWANAGNPCVRPWLFWTGPGDMDAAAADLPGYAAFHLAVGVLAFALAARGVRPPVRPTIGHSAPPPPVAVSRPPVSDRPIYWKEVNLDPVVTLLRRSWWCWLPGPTAVAMIAGGLLLPAVVELGRLVVGVQMVGRIVTVVIGFACLINVLSGAEASLSIERKRRTLDDLLLTPLPREEIALDRLWAAVRLAWWVPVTTGLLAVASAVGGGFPWVGVPALLVVQAVFLYQTVGLAGLGGVAALRRPETAVVSLSYTTAPLFLPVVLIVGAVVAFGAAGVQPAVGRFSLVGVSLPAAALASAFADQCPPDELPWYASGLVAGLAGHVLVGRWAWRATARRFAASYEPPAREGR